jgi:hypothetical protein
MTKPADRSKNGKLPAGLTGREFTGILKEK